MSEQKKYEFTVREARPEEYPGAVDALTDAFSQDPVMGKVLGGLGKTQKIKALFEFQIEHTYSKKGTIDVAITDAGEVLGAAVWISPQGLKGGLLEDIKSIPTYLKILGTSFPRAAVSELQLVAAQPKFDHWYLYVLGVHEKARSNGIGAQLLDFRRNQLGEYPAYLEASTYRNAKLYAKHGFVELFSFKGGKPALGMLHPAPTSQVSKHVGQG